MEITKREAIILGDLLGAPAPSNSDRVTTLARAIVALRARSASRQDLGEALPGRDLGARLSSVLDLAVDGSTIPDELSDDAMVADLEELAATLIELRRF